MKPTAHEVASKVWFVEATDTNFVLIGDGQEVAFVDSGYPRDRELVESSLREAGRTRGDVSAMLLTHAHADHIGSAERLRRDHGVTAHCHAEEAAHARGEVDQALSPREVFVRLWRPGVFLTTVSHIVKGGRRPERVKQVSTFSDGEMVDVPGRPMAVFTPGHTSGHAGFHLPERGVLISGDALITVDVWDSRRRGPQVIRAAFNHDHAQAIESLGRLDELEAEVVIPGHGRPFHGTPAQAVAEARRHLP